MSADVGNTAKARFGRVNARRRGPFVVWFLVETLQGLSLLRSKFYNTLGAWTIYHPSDDKASLSPSRGRGLAAEQKLVGVACLWHTLRRGLFAGTRLPKQCCFTSEVVTGCPQINAVNNSNSL